MDCAALQTTIYSLQTEKSNIEKAMDRLRGPSTAGKDSPQVEEMRLTLEEIKFQLFVLNGMINGEQLIDKEINWTPENVREAKIIDDDGNEVINLYSRDKIPFSTEALLETLFTEALISHAEYAIIEHPEMDDIIERLKELDFGFPEIFQKKNFDFSDLIHEYSQSSSAKKNEIANYLNEILPYERYVLMSANIRVEEKHELKQRINIDYNWVHEDDHLTLRQYFETRAEEAKITSFVNCCLLIDQDPDIVRKMYKRLLDMSLPELIHEMDRVKNPAKYFRKAKKTTIEEEYIM